MSNNAKNALSDLSKVADELSSRGLIDLADEIRLALDVLFEALSS